MLPRAIERVLHKEVDLPASYCILRPIGRNAGTVLTYTLVGEGMERIIRGTGLSQDDQGTHEGSLSQLVLPKDYAHPKTGIGPTVKEMGKSKSF